MGAAGIGRAALPATPPVGGGPAAPEPRPAPEPEPESDRSKVTAALTAAAILGTKAKGALIDRPRVIAAYPNAVRQEKRARWALELITGKPTNDVVPITGGTIRVAGRTLTTAAWQRAYQVSNGVGLGLLGVSMLYGFPNLIEGWHDGGGPEGLLESRQGRTGVLASVGNVVGLGVMGAAYLRSPSGPGRLAAMLHDPLHSSRPMVLMRVAVGVPVTANELGYLDFLDRSPDTTDPLRNALGTTERHVDAARKALGLV